jgi:hypothetical protein
VAGEDEIINKIDNPGLQARLQAQRCPPQHKGRIYRLLSNGEIGAPYAL